MVAVEDLVAAYEMAIVLRGVWFEFAPTPGILLGSLAFAGVMGLVGGMLPAVRASRMNILDALK